MIRATIEVEALDEDVLKDFLRVCSTIQMLSIKGASRTIPVHVDGDGSGKISFFAFGKPFPMIEDFDADNIQTMWIGE